MIDNENLVCDVEDTKNELHLRVDEVGRLTKSNNDLRSEVNDLGDNKRVIDKENLDFRAKNTELNLTITELQCEIDRLNGMLKGASGDNQSIKDALSLLEKKLDATARDLDSKNEKLTAKQAELEKSQSDFADLTSERNRLQTELKKANKRLVKFEKDEQSLLAEKEKIHNLNIQLDTLVQDLKKKIASIEKDLKSKKSEWELMLKDIQKLDAEKSKYFNEVQRLEELLELARAKEHELEKSGKEKEFLLRRIQELEDDLSKLQKTNKSLTGRLQDELAALEKIRKDYKIASEENIKFKMDQQTLSKENDKLYKDLGEYKLDLADKHT